MVHNLEAIQKFGSFVCTGLKTIARVPHGIQAALMYSDLDNGLVKVWLSDINGNQISFKIRITKEREEERHICVTSFINAP